jgi:hypothetical protein
MIANLGIASGRRRVIDRPAPETPLYRAILHYLTLHPTFDAFGEAEWEARLERIRLDDGRPPDTGPASAAPSGRRWSGLCRGRGRSRGALLGQAESESPYSATDRCRRR